MKNDKNAKQAGFEVGKAQLKLVLGFTSTKIWGITLMIANYYILVNMVSLCEELTLSSNPITH